MRRTPHAKRVVRKYPITLGYIAGCVTMELVLNIGRVLGWVR